jgi:hypothetical protein
MGLSDLAGRWPKRCDTCTAEWHEEGWNTLVLKGRAALAIDASVELRRCRCGELLGVAIACTGDDPPS